ncbi:hypothetical protein Pst134EA_003442 [Puccinia striiformis f. sp. tritici]|uniref:hypothetical protein n=1 Tax=Puccinia striiformis f. sp. tritici TaxID=168172 RepID=UPI0020074648|nr:hypothetical protein Pst134EA_003442 [Puccinia striiformis f. sp. tritici]KAH9472840.1 hypothetical protein Pst134EA_003442 [Puccinia striiformis f. sp. tritici]
MMADSDMSMTTRTAPVLIALEALAAKYDSRWREEYYSDADEENKVRTRDELDQKTKLLDEFRSILLPSIKHQLKSLSTAVLDRPQNNNEYSSLDIELTLETLSNLDRTIQEIFMCIRPGPLDKRRSQNAHDHHSKQCKAFRCFDVDVRIHDLVSEVYLLFRAYIEYITSSKLSSNHSQDTNYRPPTPREQNVVCLSLIDRTIERSGASDFALLQRNWQCTVRSLDELLETLASLIDCRQNDRSALRRSVVKQAGLTVPLIKLLRTLYNKISNTTTKTLSFTLDTELNSDTLYTLDQDPALILYPCQVYTVHLEESHKANSMISSSHSMRKRINWMSRSVDSTVVLLALYIIPLSPQIDHSSLQSDFKAWLFEWQRLWHIAKNRLVGAILLPEPEN